MLDTIQENSEIEDAFVTIGTSGEMRFLEGEELEEARKEAKERAEALAKERENPTWRQQITEEMENNGDSWDKVLLPFNPSWLDHQVYDYAYTSTFSKDSGCLIWTEEFIYFREGYDGWMHITSIPRNPDPNVTVNYIGGGC